MSSVKLKAASGGSVTLSSVNTATDYTLTVPAANATVITTASSANITQSMLGSNVAGTGPAFSAYRNDSSGNQSISSSTWTKVIMTSEDWDSANCFDSTTNYRFTPNVAGYYQVNGSIRFNYSGAASDGTWIAIYKNGSSTGIATSILNVSGNHGIRYCGGMIYLNGSTDYIELYGWSNHASSFFQTDTLSNTRFSGFLARAA